MLFREMLALDADVLLRETNAFTKQDRWVTAQLLVRLAAVEARELFAPCGYASMWEYCLGELGMSDDAAGRRLWAARKCREFPALFDALADGRIHLTAVHILATYLHRDNVDELITAATSRSKVQLKEWLACRFPRPAVPTVIRPVTTSAGLLVPPTALEPGPGTTGDTRLTSCASATTPDLVAIPPSAQPSPFAATPASALHESHDSHALARVPVPSVDPCPPIPQVPLRERAHVDPLNAEQVKVQFTMSRRALSKMQHAQDLLGHQVPPQDIAALFEKLLDMAIPALERRKFAATDRPSATASASPSTPLGPPAANPRTIPAHVKRAVWKRDGGRCTFLSGTGRRCNCTRGLEYDHVKPVALGGEATVANLRLLCRRHNQLEAERRLGREFMRSKRRVSLTGHAPAREPDANATHPADSCASLASPQGTRTRADGGFATAATP